MAVKPPAPRLPSLRALRAFEAAARHESFPRAAAELGVTPGAVAQQVKSLEDWLGRPLFRRRAQGLELLPGARRVLPELGAAFDGLGAAVRRLREESGSERLHLAALPALAQLWLQPRLPALRAALPPGTQISLTALEEPPDLLRGPYDLALFYAVPGEEAAPEAGRGTGGKGGRARLLPLAEERLLPVCTPGLARRLGLEAGPAALSDAQLLHDASWAADWRRWLAAAGRPAADPAAGTRFSLYAVALQAALDGEGLLMGRESLVARELARGALVAPFALRLAIPERPCLLLPPDGPRGGTAAALAERLAALAAPA